MIDLDQMKTAHTSGGRTRLGWVCFAPLALAKWVLVGAARFLNRGGNRTIRYVYWPLYFGLAWLCTLLLTMFAGA